MEIYTLLQNACCGDSFDAAEAQLMNLCNVYNANLIVTDSRSQTLYSTFKDPEQISLQLRDVVFSRDGEVKRIIGQGEGYTMCYMKDPFSQTDYITMWGNLDADSFFLIRTAVESIRDSVRMSNGFLLYVGLVAMLLAGIVIWMVSARIAVPILNLADISRKMANLNFETKYQGGGNNEIALLGENMNLMSERLEDTISHLKTANLELQKDVDARRSADQRRSEFIANVSHELKTPIALIQGYAEGLKEGVIDDRESLEYYCDVIMDETHKMNHLVKRLISLNQVESGADAMQMERFDINELIVHCLKSFEPLTEQQQIRVFYEEGSGKYVWADEYQTEEVLRNYFSNAVHYCSGRKEIHVKAATSDDAQHIRISVFNTGEPIPEESLGQLWDKFYKVDKARTREYGGSGLGLSIVKAIMESMKQEFGVRNYEDGVEFWFELETK